MKYYLIAGEASGDLHASHLMAALKERDDKAEFRIIGGDMMEQQGATLVRHYSTLAYMGWIPVITHLPTILQGMRECKRDIIDWHPDMLILVDYPGFNLNIAEYIKKKAPEIKVFYYISPKIWAWKEWRIKKIRSYVDKLYSILPFEVDYFRNRHNYDIDYVGNPTLDEVTEYKKTGSAKFVDFIDKNQLDSRPVIAILAGSRKQEIRDNLSRMLQAVEPWEGEYQILIAGAPNIEASYYDKYIKGHDARILYGQTYDILSNATAALVTSGTATLETALFGVPQVVCYHGGVEWMIRLARYLFLKIQYVSLVNLIADREVVPELLANDMNVENVRCHLSRILPGGADRDEMLRGYEEVVARLGEPGAPRKAAAHMIPKLC